MPALADHSAALRIARSHASQLVGNYGFVPDDHGDLVQDLLLEFIRRRKNFDPKRSGLITFTQLVIRNGAASMIEARRAQRRDYRLSQPLEHESYGASARIKLRANSDLDVIGLQLDVRKTISRLCPDLALLAQLLETHTITEISRIIRRPRCTIYRQRAKLRRIFEDAGLHNYICPANSNRPHIAKRKRGNRG